MDASEIIRRVREIQVRTGRHVADVLAGEYVSVFKGGGVEFEEVRPYVAGDDVRSIDWNVTDVHSLRVGQTYFFKQSQGFFFRLCPTPLFMQHQDFIHLMSAAHHGI